jgi:hypothetical protein
MVDIKDDGKEEIPSCGQPKGCHENCPPEFHGNGEYWYEPSPAKLDPPIPRNAMMHFYHSPQEAGTTRLFLDSLPKRNECLQLGTGNAYKIGWGLSYKEEISWPMIITVEGVIGAFSLAWFMAHTKDLTVASPPTVLVMAFGTIILTLMKEIANRNVS